MAADGAIVQQKQTEKATTAASQFTNLIQKSLTNQNLHS